MGDIADEIDAWANREMWDRLEEKYGKHYEEAETGEIEHSAGPAARRSQALEAAEAALAA